MALSVMESYKARTNGSYTWRNAASVGFSYYMADPEFGRLQASSLTNVLKTTLRAFSVKVVHEAGTVFCAPQGVDKGAFCARIAAGNLEGASSPLSLSSSSFGKVSTDYTTPFDFVLCMGDNLSDEQMFEVVNQFGTKSSSSSSNTSKGCAAAQRRTRANRNSLSPEIGGSRKKSEDRRRDMAKGSVFTVTIRPKPTNAKFYVDSVQDVHDVLESLAMLEMHNNSSMRKSFSLSSMNNSSGSGFMTKAHMTGMGSSDSHSHLVGNSFGGRRARHGERKLKRVYTDDETRTSKGPPGNIPGKPPSESTIMEHKRQQRLSRRHVWWKSPPKLILLWMAIYLVFARRKVFRFLFGRG